jgi:EAL domain-containing protein (putative c-di-GMP-specific phosphodiesterase class I)
MWVNVSARQLTHELLPQLEQLVARHGLLPGALGLELTESVLMRDLPAAQPLLAQIRQLGIRLAIDDFGTGYSSLAYLAELPVDIVKIDQGFTAQLTSGGRGAAVITAVLALAASIGIQTVVEGVENAEQLITLRELGVTTVQGHYFAAAAPSSACPPTGTRLPHRRPESRG